MLKTLARLAHARELTGRPGAQRFSSGRPRRSPEPNGTRRPVQAAAVDRVRGLQDGARAEHTGRGARRSGRPVRVLDAQRMVGLLRRSVRARVLPRAARRAEAANARHTTRRRIERAARVRHRTGIRAVR